MSAENELRLEVAAGRARGFSLVVDERLVIGRNSDDPGRLADDPELSRHHAEIVRAPNGEFTVRDLSSTNGTFVNGIRLNSPAVLTVGDEIGVGSSKLIVRSAPVAAAPPPRPEVDVRAATMGGGVLGTIDPSAGEEQAPTIDPSAEQKQAPTIDPPTEAEQAPAEPEASTEGAPLTVRVTVDFEQETAQLSVHGPAEPFQMVLENGRWRADDRAP